MQKKFKNIRAVFFDAGNTLIYPDYLFIQEVLAEYGLAIDLAKIRAAEYHAKAAVHKTNSSKPWNIYFGTWFEAVGAKKDDLPTIFNKLWQRHRQKNLWSRLDEDVIETLTELKKRKYASGVISNSDGRLAKLLAELALSKYLDVIVDSEQIGLRKPDAGIFEFALDQLNVTPHTALYVGDMYDVDVLGAQKAGLTPILFDPLDKLSHITCLKITCLKQLLDMLP
ncbi:MAG: HAD family hydrolase [bacterium]